MFADKNKASYREERYAFITTIVSLLDFTEPNPGLGIGNTEKSLTTKVLGVPSILPTSLNYVNIKNKNKKEKQKAAAAAVLQGMPHSTSEYCTSWKSAGNGSSTGSLARTRET